jgi:hypothetical protein
MIPQRLLASSTTGRQLIRFDNIFPTAAEISVSGFTEITSRDINWLTEVEFHLVVRASTRKMSLSETTPMSRHMCPRPKNAEKSVLPLK